MSVDEPAVARASELRHLSLVYDLVTSCVDTKLIAEAKRAGVATISGIEMLLAQGAAQFEIWTGREAPKKVMADALAER
jgi:shikimate dehydrogenase